MTVGIEGTRGEKTARFVAVAISAELVWQMVGANMSSPQTAELNAAARAPTINKWVNMTTAEAAAWVVFLCWLDGSAWPVLGGVLAGGGMLLKYRYAINSGLQNGGPPTESYG